MGGTALIKFPVCGEGYRCRAPTGAIMGGTALIKFPVCGEGYQCRGAIIERKLQRWWRYG